MAYAQVPPRAAKVVGWYEPTQVTDPPPEVNEPPATAVCATRAVAESAPMPFAPEPLATIRPWCSSKTPPLTSTPVFDELPPDTSTSSDHAVTAPPSTRTPRGFVPPVVITCASTSRVLPPAFCTY